MLNRLRAEGLASPCDVFWGGGAESLAANSDLFLPRVSSEDAFIRAEWKAQDRSWTGFTVLPMVIAYNARLLPAQAVPRRWADLFEPRFQGAIAFADPGVSASSYTLLRTIEEALGARDGPARSRVEAAFARALEGRLVAVSAAVFPSVASGENLVGLYHDEAALELLSSGSDLRVVYPEDGTSAVPDGVALARASAHQKAAGDFIDFALGPDVARVVTTRFHRRSARSDTAPPLGQPPLSTIRLVAYDVQAAARDKAATLDRFAALAKEEAARVRSTY
jgi:iron(III) transport system substrate-binding protein